MPRPHGHPPLTLPTHKIVILSAAKDLLFDSRLRSLRIVPGKEDPWA